jgi:hypothetical protein
MAGLCSSHKRRDLPPPSLYPKTARYSKRDAKVALIWITLGVRRVRKVKKMDKKLSC